MEKEHTETVVDEAVLSRLSDCSRALSKARFPFLTVSVFSPWG
jgi:hypothetical protein